MSNIKKCNKILLVSTLLLVAILPFSSNSDYSDYIMYAINAVYVYFMGFGLMALRKKLLDKTENKNKQLIIKAVIGLLIGYIILLPRIILYLSI